MKTSIYSTKNKKTKMAKEEVKTILGENEGRRYLWDNGYSQHNKFYVSMGQLNIRKDIDRDTYELEEVPYLKEDEVYKSTLNENEITNMLEDKFKVKYINDLTQLNKRDISLIRNVAKLNKYKLKIGYTTYKISGRYPNRKLIYKLEGQDKGSYYFSNLEGLVELIKNERM